MLRYYRTRYRIKHGSIVDAQSEAGASVSITPNGNDTGITVTKPASISESETHWVIEGSMDNATFYELSEVAVGTGTYLDQANPREEFTNALEKLRQSGAVRLKCGHTIAVIGAIRYGTFS